MNKIKNRIAGFFVVFGREFHAYFDSPIAYIYAIGFLLLSNSIFMNGFFLTGLVDMTPFFEILPLLLIPFISAMTMRLWAEERSQFTFELLMTLPLQPGQIILGKYMAAVAFYCLILTGSLPIVAMLVSLGTPDMGLLFSSYVGAFLLGAFFLSFGVFASGLTKDQIVAFVISTFMGCLFVLTGVPQVVEVLDGLTPQHQWGTWLYESVSVMPHYNSFVQGVIRVSDLFYFGAFIFFFLWMNDIYLKRSRA